MWWLWPHLRRLWAGVGTVTAGLIVTWLYSLLSAQALPHVSIASTLLREYWPWLASGLIAFAMVSLITEPRIQSRLLFPLRFLALILVSRFGQQRPAIGVLYYRLHNFWAYPIQENDLIARPATGARIALLPG
jgi:hypothetical protein